MSPPIGANYLKGEVLLPRSRCVPRISGRSLSPSSTRNSTASTSSASTNGGARSASRQGIPRNYHEEPVLYGFGAAPELPDGSPVTYQAGGVLFMKRYQYRVWGLAFALTQVLVEDGDHIRIGQIYAAPSGQSLIETKETPLRQRPQPGVQRLVPRRRRRGAHRQQPSDRRTATFSNTCPRRRPCPRPRSSRCSSRSARPSTTTASTSG